MSKKTLQNNFTTVSQSKKLLELGVPARSADCIRVIDTNVVFVLPDGRNIEDYIDKYNDERNIKAGPCWSVGQLIEIFEICSGQVWQNEIIENYSKIDMLFEDFEDVEKKYTFDFSKLEE